MAEVYLVKKVIFKLISMTDGWGISCKIALRWMPLDLTDDKSTLVQVMAWCRQATSYYLSQCWPRFMSPYGVTRPQCVNWNFLKFVPKGPIEHKHDNPAFVEVMAWCWTGNKTFHVLIMAQFTDTMWCHKATVNLHYGLSKTMYWYNFFQYISRPP